MRCTDLLLSIVVLNYRNPDLTAKCVRTALASALEARLPAEMIVVDNSAPETGRVLRSVLPAEVQIIENKENLGFARANNQGIKASKGRFILLLNNDCFIRGNCLGAGVQFLEAHPEAAVWAPRLTDGRGRPQVSCARLPSLRGLAGEYLFARCWDWYTDVSRWTAPTRVGTVIGAFFLLHRWAVERVGLLDEDYFFNVEDVDYCTRLHHARLSVIYDPRFTAVHLGSASQEGRIFLDDDNLHRGRVLYFRKHRGNRVARLASAIILLGLAARRFKLCLKSASRSLLTP